VKIRIAKEEDLPRIVEIYNQAVIQGFCTADTLPLKVEDRICWFSEHDPDRFPIFVAEENQSIQGWCSLGSYRCGRKALENVAEISYYVDKHSRKKRIGSKLLAYTISKAPEFGFNNFLAILLDVNIASIRLLEKYGFEKWGHFPDIAEFETGTCGQFVYGKKV
jgi:L-amino acid N-acyltransferase YncA